MIDDKTIRQQRNRITAFFICVAMFILPLILFRIRLFMNLLDRLYYLLHEGTGSGASSIVEGEWEYTDSLQKYSWELSVLLIPSGCFLIGSIVVFFACRIPMAFEILRDKRIEKKYYAQKNGTVKPADDFTVHAVQSEQIQSDRNSDDRSENHSEAES